MEGYIKNSNAKRGNFCGEGHEYFNPWGKVHVPVYEIFEIGCMKRDYSKNKRPAVGSAGLLQFPVVPGDGFMVPRDGIGPPTRGFSVHCSTD
jgi:hypothetical protein